MTRFIALGECMIELAPTGAPDTYHRGFAGDTFNTAWYMRQLCGAETSVEYLSAIGDDEPSVRMQEFISSAGIVPHLAVIPNRTVGLYMISLKEGERSFAYWREASAARQLARDLSALEGLKAGDIAYFSGISLAILSPDDRRVLLDTLATQREKGVTIAFDPNLRPRLWESPVKMCEAIMKAAAVSDIALPSHDDEATFFGDSSLTLTAERYAEAGVKLCVVKNGPGLIEVNVGGVSHRIQPDPVMNVVDTTAAGDAFNAGFFAEYLTSGDGTSAALAGCVVSAKVISSRGALVEL